MRELIALALAPLAACGSGGPDDPDGLARRVIAEQCGACHEVPGVDEARGKVGPSLAGIGTRQVIGGKLPNSRENLIRWISHAQSVSPGSVMPDIPLTHEQAGAIADYLYSLD